MRLVSLVLIIPIVEGAVILVRVRLLLVIHLLPAVKRSMKLSTGACNRVIIVGHEDSSLLDSPLHCYDAIQY